MSELAQAIQKMRNMRESYDQLAATADLYQQGREALAAAITAKGVPTTPTTPLTDMAQNVADISQVVREIDGGEMYPQQIVGGADPATSPLWNLYEVLAQLKNQYLVSSGGNYQGILLGRFYKGYERIELSLADAYVTSDGAFYTAGATHIWANKNDVHADRWVAYLFASENSNFIIQTQSLCPRDIYIGGSIGSITFYTNGRLGSIVCGIEETDVLGRIVGLDTYTNPWAKDVVIRNLNTFPYSFNPGTNCENLILSGKSISVNQLINLISSSATNIVSFCAPDLESIQDTNYNTLSQCFRYQTAIVVAKFPKLKRATDGGAGVGFLFMYDGEQKNLIDFEVGAMETHLRTAWNPTNILNSTSMKTQLIINIKNHILARVSDRTGLSRLKFTVSTNMFNAISGETITWNDEEMTLADAFLTKNWLLAGA